jgi:hypothetical protein
MAGFKLIDGCLPPHEKCPVPDCPCSEMLEGKPRDKAFSCGLLRGWLMTTEGKKFLQEHGEKRDETDQEGTPASEF